MRKVTFSRAKKESSHSDTGNEDAVVAVDVFGGLEDGEDSGQGGLKCKCREGSGHGT
jgi:hypothetical protein